MDNLKDSSDHGELTNNIRYIAVKLLNRFDRSDSYIDKLLAHTFRSNELDARDKALLTELVNGVTRWRLKLDYVLIGFYRGDYQKCLNIVKNAMRIGLYQILYMDSIPEYAAINESVNIVKHVQCEKTAGIVNGVLRNILRNVSNIHYPPRHGRDFYYAIGIEHSHPKWMAKRFCFIYGDRDGEELMKKNNERPYTAIRINSLVSSIEEVRKIFDTYEPDYLIPDFAPTSMIFENPKYQIINSDLFNEGKITIQDPAAASACRLAAPEPGIDVADICAAPGGKSFFLAELMENKGRITAYDLHPYKLKLIIEGARRLNIDIIETEEADAKVLKPEKQFDLVFADVPCTGFGTIRKKSDIKWKREHSDIETMAAYQKELLDNAVDMVKPGGVLLYSTCSIDPMENEDNISYFLEKHPDFTLDRAENYLPEVICKDGMMKILPHVHGTDGAFAARLIKANL